VRAGAHAENAHVASVLRRQTMPTVRVPRATVPIERLPQASRLSVLRRGAFFEESNKRILVKPPWLSDHAHVLALEGDGSIKNPAHLEAAAKRVVEDPWLPATAIVVERNQFFARMKDRSLVPLLRPGARAPTSKVAIDALASYVSSAGHARDLVKGIGFHPEAYGLAQAPPATQIAAAVGAAEAAAPGSGAKDALALMSRNLAKMYSSARHEQSLAPFLKRPVGEPIAFAPKADLTPPALGTFDRGTQAAIETIASYTSEGLANHLLVTHWALSPEDADHFLARSESFAHAVALAHARLAPPAQEAALAGASATIRARFRAAKSDPGLVRAKVTTN
jgi:hypothetical protein